MNKFQSLPPLLKIGKSRVRYYTLPSVYSANDLLQKVKRQTIEGQMVECIKGKINKRQNGNHKKMIRI